MARSRLALVWIEDRLRALRGPFIGKNRKADVLEIQEQSDGSILVPLKVVPGAKRDQVCGLLGTRLKIRVSAPPEAGKANNAVCGLLAKHLGVRRKDVEIVRGTSDPEKVVRIVGASAEAIKGLTAE